VSGYTCVWKSWITEVQGTTRVGLLHQGHGQAAHVLDVATSLLLSLL
jgi:hypothetical protein